MTAPKYSIQIDQLKPSNSMGIFYLSIGVSLTVFGGWLSNSLNFSIWFMGQFILAFALLQWFILLHEAGHQTLFKNRNINSLVGHLAGGFSGFPFLTWKQIHFRHHKWTGWQDLDATTASLVPRKLNRYEQVVINFCWRYWIPLFSFLYRINNYWNYPRVKRYVTSAHLGKIALNILILVLIYGAMFYIYGPSVIFKYLGFAILLSLIFQEILILSQHTHIPYLQSKGKQVTPITLIDQENFTRSLIFPKWFSTYILMNFDAHELHHMYLKVPGYYLGRIDYKPRNQVSVWKWIKETKRMSGVKFLFQNRSETGLEL